MDVDSPSPKKCRRVNRGVQQMAVRRRRRSLENLQEMPMDVLYEILSHLHPTDLLNLARTNKTWRTWIMSRSQRILWRRSLRQIQGLPDCPDDMTEPAYAFLMLKSDCHFCKKTPIHPIEFLCRVRCCIDCRRNGKNFLAVPRWEAVGVAELLPVITEPRSVIWVPHAAWSEHLARKRAIAKEPIHKHAELLETYRKERLAIMEDLHRTSAEMSEWLEQSRIDRSNEVARLREERVQQVMTRLEDMGWAEEVSKLDEGHRNWLMHTKAMSSHTRLTDRVWKNVQDELIAVLRKAQESRIRTERSKPYVDILLEHNSILDDFARNMPDWRKSLPPKADFWLHPEVQHLLQQETQAHSPSLGEDLARLIPVVVSEWESMVTDTLLEMMVPFFQELKLLNQDTSLSAVASDWGACTWWRCTHCGCRTMDILHVMHHWCLRRSIGRFVDMPQTSEEDLLNAVGAVHSRTKRMTVEDLRDAIQIDYSACQRAVQITTVLCGKSIARPSLQEMAALDPRLGCMRCEVILPWRHAVHHQCADGADPFAFELYLLGSCTTAHAEDLVMGRLPPALWSMYMSHYCTRCRTYKWEDCQEKGIDGRIALRAHLSSVHDVTHDPVHGIDYIHRVGERYYEVSEYSENIVSFAEFVARHGYSPLRDPMELHHRFTSGPLVDQVVDSETLSAMTDTHRDLIRSRYI